MQENAYSLSVANAPPGGATVKSPRELDLMREAGRIVALTLKHMREILEPGMTTRELDAVAESDIRGMDAIPAFKGYHGFPATLFISLNDQIVHGIPGDLVIKKGDLVSIDCGAIVGGLYGDSAVTVAAGDVPAESLRLLEVTEGSLMAGIEQVHVGHRIGDVSAAIQAYIENQGGYGIVREYVGHGIGRALHEDPQIPNFGPPGRGLVLRPGMAVAIEPMVNLGTHMTRTLDDDWTVVTADGGLSAHFEHTILVTEDGPEITTKL